MEVPQDFPLLAESSDFPKRSLQSAHPVIKEMGLIYCVQESNPSLGSCMERQAVTGTVRSRRESQQERNAERKVCKSAGHFLHI